MTIGRSILTLALVLAALWATAADAEAKATPGPSWKVLAATGPTNLPPVQSEVQQITLGAGSGAFTLAHSLVEGKGRLSFGSGLFPEFEEGSNVVSFFFAEEVESFGVGEEITESEGFLPPGTVIEAVDVPAGKLTVSQPATKTGFTFELKAAGKDVTGVTGHFTVDDELEGEGIPAGTTVAAVGPGTLTLSEYPTAGGVVVLSTPTETTAQIPYDASASQVQTALQALPGYESGTFSVTGGPGGSAGTPYVIAFGGSLKDVDVAPFVVASTGLGESGYVHVATTIPGGSGTGEIAIFPTNVGGAATDGEITVELGPLPAGIVTAGKAEGSEAGHWTCSTEVSQVRCTSADVVPALTPMTPITVPVEVESALASSAQVGVSVSGGEAGAASYPLPIVISSRPAPPGIAAYFSGALEADGSPASQAGGHPYSLVTAFHVNSIRGSDGRIIPSGDVKDVNVDLQPGLVGSPLITARCPHALPFPTEAASTQPACDYGEKEKYEVGYIFPGTNGFGALGIEGLSAPFFNNVPVTGAAAQFSTKLAQPVSTLLGKVRSEEDFGIQVKAPDSAIFESVYYIDTVFYGEPPGAGGRAFFRNPTDCGEQARQAPVQSLAASSWQLPTEFSTVTERQPAVTGCDNLHFEPEFDFQPSSTEGSSGAGATAHLHIDQEDLTNPAALATPDLKQSVVTLPQGLDLNPAQANGLQACSEAQVGYKGSGELPNPTRFDNDPVTCPDASKLGTVEATSPLLEEPLKGTIYLAAQEENPFNSLIALYLVFESERFGITLKLPGKVDTDSNTGQVSATFDYVPQQPIEDLALDFRGGGARSEFATPEVCGTYTTKSVWTPWSAPESGPPAEVSSPFTVAGGCSSSAGARPFHPTFEGGSVTPVAGAYSPLVIKIHRNDGEQELKNIDFTLPPGELGKLAGIPYCPESAIAEAGSKTGKQELAAPSCPSASQIGTVDAAAGVGSEPVHVGGKVYLAGPYKGAPLSAVVVTPAVAGPFDLGDVVIRSPLIVNPETAQITAKSDPIPTILRGIPLKLRSAVISIDRPDFSLNPTNCEAMQISATVGSSDGTSTTLAHRFQVGSCERLAFKPKLQLSLKGSTKHAGHPALKAVLTYPKEGAYANVARAQVNLPHSEFIDQGNLDKTCTRPVLLEGRCPARSIYGKARAWTPLLEKPLEGPVYLVGGYGYKLPALVAELDGQIRVLLVGKIDSGPNKGIRSTFEAIPDAPVSRFVLEMKGGKRYSLLENSEPLCRKPQRAIARFTAQNGRVQQTKPLIQNECGKKPKKGKKPKH